MEKLKFIEEKLRKSMKITLEDYRSLSKLAEECNHKFMELEPQLRYFLCLLHNPSLNLVQY